MKPYKTAVPEDTIFNIRKILHLLGIDVTEQHFRKDGLYYSCRITIDNNNIRFLDIGTNGKGMSSIYSLASAYGEFMERIQNKMFTVATKYATSDFRKNLPEKQIGDIPILDFLFFPEERLEEVPSEKIQLYFQELLPNTEINTAIDFKGNDFYKIHYADFYNTYAKKVESLPYTLLRFAASSTGLCAGNTPEEAILQGLNEIFERYVLQQIYLRRCTPPSIPLTMFDNTEIGNRLHRLQAETRWKIEVKDCSLGEGFPVLGLLLIDVINNQYSFRLGADVSPEIALQRCFTEAFQGSNVNNKYMRPIVMDEDWDLQAEHNRSVIDGCGQFPKEIFSNVPSWDFKGFHLSRKETHSEELKSVCSWLKSKNYTLFVRDNSFLGFPAYHLYIPGLSDINSSLYDTKTEIKRYNANFHNVKNEYRVPSLKHDEILSFIAKYEKSVEKNIKLFPYNAIAYNSFNRLLILALLSYKVGKDKDAYKFMKSFLYQKEAEGTKQSPYYYCIRDFFYAKSSSCYENAIAILENIYSKALVQEVISDMNDRENVLTNLPLSNCFNCNKCKIKNTCRYKDVIDIEKRIQLEQAKYLHTQIELQKIFE